MDGSTTAGLRTTAHLTGDDWVVSGQKIWTSCGAYADWLFVLCRTDPSSAAHRGLSLILVPVDQAGVDVRPIRNIAGEKHFCEVFLDGARTPADCIVGEEGDGWNVALASLGMERLTTVLPFQMTWPGHLEEVMAELRRRGQTRDVAARHALADVWSGLRINEWLHRRLLETVLRGDTADAITSVAKLGGATWHRSATSRMLDLLGAHGMLLGDDHGAHRTQSMFLNAMAGTIYGGTSEVQRNIIGERVLGLPREPR